MAELLHDETKKSVLKADWKELLVSHCIGLILHKPANKELDQYFVNMNLMLL